ncbi:uncharacterized protein LOC115240445 isoform X2 [Formica exsecta]|uniref:uncharacterized protein LOC115240445 isoform X2 n=1 Tax=Formica exsecta TaxID=72781 RepID=UPI00114491A1|nr:uncharacterized protein LOC115240445 isoform X2 [Formica exsecta]
MSRRMLLNDVALKIDLIASSSSSRFTSVLERHRWTRIACTRIACTILRQRNAICILFLYFNNVIYQMSLSRRRIFSEGELLEKNTDWIYEWSSRPDQAPPKDWKFKHPLGSKRKTYSIRTAKVGKNGLFSKEVIYTLFFTNLLSLLIGTGLGVLLTRRGLMMSRVAIE